MVSVRLDYRRDIVPQETPYWCGPASVQVILNSRGIDVSEPILARELGTTTRGTDHVGLFPPVLRKYLPDSGFVVRQMPNDPPQLSQVGLLWEDLISSIDAGYGVIANIVAPPSNYPQGVNGSSSPLYRGGTVYHYFCIMGYSDGAEEGTQRAVWVADSGFSPFGYWMSFSQLASLIPPKGYLAYPHAPRDTADDQLWDDVLMQFMGPTHG